MCMRSDTAKDRPLYLTMIDDFLIHNYGYYYALFFYSFVLTESEKSILSFN